MTRRGRRPSPYVLFLVLSAVMAAGLALLCALWLGIGWLWAWLIGVSLSTVACYGYDKAAARKQWLRIPEAVLHLPALLGGSVAAWLAQQTFRHKTIKGRFRIVFWLIAALQVAGVILWIRYA